MRMLQISIICLCMWRTCNRTKRWTIESTWKSLFFEKSRF